MGLGKIRRNAIILYIFVIYNLEQAWSFLRSKVHNLSNIKYWKRIFCRKIPGYFDYLHPDDISSVCSTLMKRSFLENYLSNFSWISPTTLVTLREQPFKVEPNKKRFRWPANDSWTSIYYPHFDRDISESEYKFFNSLLRQVWMKYCQIWMTCQIRGN